VARRNQLEDVFKKYDLSGGLNDGRIHHELCWPWKESLNGKGIPYFSVDGKLHPSHRVVYHVMHPDTFPLNDPRLIRHVVCDNGICGNFNHMEPGTHQENMNDAVDHGRFGLTTEIIHAIINLKEEMPDLTHVRIAEHITHKFQRNVARSTVTDILTDRRRTRRKQEKDNG
jgi:hypothetical protein